MKKLKIQKKKKKQKQNKKQKKTKQIIFRIMEKLFLSY